MTFRNSFATRFTFYKRDHPGLIRKITTDTGSKLVVGFDKSTRHPDVSLYLTDPPAGEQPWRDWTPQIVVEIVSETSRRRDYVDKIAEYWQAGVGEYWIIDPADEQVQRCRRGEADGVSWEITVLRGEQPLTTDLLPGFALTPVAVFAAQK